LYLVIVQGDVLDLVQIFIAMCSQSEFTFCHTDLHHASEYLNPMYCYCIYNFGILAHRNLN